MLKPLRNKKILITAGPTWVPIDRVRVISNVSSGRTGMTIAQYASKAGADVTLLLGPVDAVVSSQLPLGPESPVRNMSSGRGSVGRLKIIRFRYFDELLKLIRQQLKKTKYDIIIHGAAVSDYRPVKTSYSKIKSGKKRLAIHLEPTVKIIDTIRQEAKGAFLVMFKLEAGKPDKELIETAYKKMRFSKADLIVANNIDDISEDKHMAYIIDLGKRAVAVETKRELARALIGKVSKRL